MDVCPIRPMAWVSDKKMDNLAYRKQGRSLFGSILGIQLTVLAPPPPPSSRAIRGNALSHFERPGVGLYARVGMWSNIRVFWVAGVGLYRGVGMWSNIRMCYVAAKKPPLGVLRLAVRISSCVLFRWHG